MTTKNVTLTGMQPRYEAGHYFEILSGGPVDIYFFDKDRRMLAVELAVSAGYYLDRRGLVGFDSFDIDFGGVAQAIKYFITDGTGGQKSASTQITSSVPATGVAITPAKVTVANGVSTALLAANANRKYLRIAVPSTALQSVFVREDGGVAVADATSLELRPGQVWEPPVAPVGAINALANGAAVDVNVAQG